MKKRKKILSILLLVVICLFATGCGNKKTISAEGFKEKLEAKNFTLSDATNQFIEYDYVKKVYIAQNPKKTYQIEYYYFDDESKAKEFYKNNKTFFENSEGKVSSYSEVNVANYSKYSQNKAGNFSVISRVENTAIYVNVNDKYKSEITEILKELDY